MTGPAPALTWPAILALGTVAFTVDGRAFTVPPHPTRTWVAALTSGDLEDVLPGLLPADQQQAWAELLWREDPQALFTPGVHRRVVDAVIARAAGDIPWTGVHTLLGSVQSAWRNFEGWATDRHIELLELPLHRFCNLAYHRIVRNMDDKDRVMFDADLFAVAPDADADVDVDVDVDDEQGAPPGWSTQEMGAAFTQALAVYEAAPGRRPGQ